MARVKLSLVLFFLAALLTGFLILVLRPYLINSTSMFFPNSSPSPKLTAVLPTGSLVFSPSPSFESAIITFVHDGDTVYTSSFKSGVRLLGIDAPELTGYKSKTDQCFGQEAKNQLIDLVLHQKVELLTDPQSSNLDVYGRRLRYLELHGQDINLMLISQGFAKAESFGHAHSREKIYQAASRQAQEKGLGLWSACPKGQF